jgi:hypothetical protein
LFDKLGQSGSQLCSGEGRVAEYQVTNKGFNRAVFEERPVMVFDEGLALRKAFFT